MMPLSAIIPFATSIIGLLLMSTVLVSRSWNVRTRKVESRLIFRLIVIIVTALIVSPVSYIVDGSHLLFGREINLISNVILFICCVLASWTWDMYVAQHLNGGPAARHSFLLSVPMLLVIVVSLMNFFFPVLFIINDKNVYCRSAGFYVVFAVNMFYILHGVLCYVVSRRKGGMMKFFSVGMYVITLVTGIVMQTIFLRLAFEWPCAAVAFTGLVLNLQSDIIYRDELTGIFNKSYLTYLQQRMVKGKSGPVTGLMLDLNDFKSINDMMGHAEGDRALIMAADIFMKSVGEYGTVIRYAGDEFVVMINTQDMAVVDSVIANIKQRFDDFNKSAEAKYTLSAAIGYETFYPDKESVDEFMNNIDRKMYEDKARYYAVNGHERRRK